jgi:hypothetical protein
VLPLRAALWINRQVVNDVDKARALFQDGIMASTQWGKTCEASLGTEHQATVNRAGYGAGRRASSGRRESGGPLDHEMRAGLADPDPDSLEGVSSACGQLIAVVTCLPIASWIAGGGLRLWSEARATVTGGLPVVCVGGCRIHATAGEGVGPDVGTSPDVRVLLVVFQREGGEALDIIASFPV